MIAGLLVIAALPTAAGAAANPSRRPTVPQDVTVTAAPGQLVVSWSPPAYNGEYRNRLGVDVPYVITDYDLKGVPEASWAACPDLALTCPLVGLKVGHTYKIAVKVWNALGKHSTWTTPVDGHLHRLNGAGRVAAGHPAADHFTQSDVIPTTAEPSWSLSL